MAASTHAMAHAGMGAMAMSASMTSRYPPNTVMPSEKPMSGSIQSIPRHTVAVTAPSIHRLARASRPRTRSTTWSTPNSASAAVMISRLGSSSSNTWGK